MSHSWVAETRARASSKRSLWSRSRMWGLPGVVHSPTYAAQLEALSDEGLAGGLDDAAAGMDPSSHSSCRIRGLSSEASKPEALG